MKLKCKYILEPKEAADADGIPDEFLLINQTQPEQLFLFELIERRYDKATMIFCTQYRMEDNHNRLDGGVHADAILDRIIQLMWRLCSPASGTCRSVSL